LKVGQIKRPIQILNKKWLVDVTGSCQWVSIFQYVIISVYESVFSPDPPLCPIFRPGDTILISTGVVHIACNIQIIKPVCLVCGGLAIYQALESEWILLVT
jgi:hypothetical protein